MRQMIHTSKSSGFNVGGSVTIGLGSDVYKKSNSAGVNFSYGKSSSTGLSSLIDLNGDNLPDKVFQTNNGVYLGKVKLVVLRIHSLIKSINSQY